MMDELINVVSEKTGMSQEQSQEAVNAVVGFLKERLPAPLAGMLSSHLGGEQADGAAAGGGLAGEATEILGKLLHKDS